MQSGSDGARRDTEHLRHLVHGQVQKTAQHDDRAVLHRELAEPVLELVTVVDLTERVDRGGRLGLGDVGDAGQITPLSGLPIAGVDEDPIGPGLVGGRVTKAADVAPDVDKSSLGRILGRLGVPEDAVGHAVQAGAVRERQGLEGALLAVLCPDHQISVHAPIRSAGVGDSGHGAALVAVPLMVWVASKSGHSLVASNRSAGRHRRRESHGLVDPDTALVDTLIDRLDEELCLDLARVYATGFSIGAAGTSVLGCVLDDRLAAVAPVGGVVAGLGDTCNTERPVSVLAIHGINELDVSFEGGAPDWFLSLAMKDGSQVRDSEWGRWLVSVGLRDTVPDRVATTAVGYGCESEPVIEPLGNAQHYVWACPDGVAVELVAHDGGHVWPSSTDGRTTEQLIWDFFEQHPMPE